MRALEGLEWLLHLPMGHLGQDRWCHILQHGHLALEEVLDFHPGPGEVGVWEQMALQTKVEQFRLYIE